MNPLFIAGGLAAYKYFTSDKKEEKEKPKENVTTQEITLISEYPSFSNGIQVTEDGICFFEPEVAQGVISDLLLRGAKLITNPPGADGWYVVPHSKSDAPMKPLIELLISQGKFLLISRSALLMRTGEPVCPILCALHPKSERVRKLASEDGKFVVLITPQIPENQGEPDAPLVSQEEVAQAEPESNTSGD